MFQDVGARIRGRNDLRRGEELGVAAAVVGMMVSAEHIFHRLIGDALYVRDNGVVIPIVLVIDQNDAFAGNQYGDVAAVTFDVV